MDGRVPTLEEEIDAARRRFIAWLEWYRQAHADDSGEPLSKQELANRLGRGTRSAISLLLDPKRRRTPDFQTLVAAARLLEFGYEALLTRDPPPVPKRRK